MKVCSIVLVQAHPGTHRVFVLDQEVMVRNERETGEECLEQRFELYHCHILVSCPFFHSVVI